ncbi:hypothetical protein ACOMHN_038383 [Nucella lapillus]
MSLGSKVFSFMLRRSPCILATVQSSKVKVTVSTKNLSTVSAWSRSYQKVSDAERENKVASLQDVKNRVKMSSLADKNPASSNIIFRQLLDYKSYTYTYILADPESRAAVVIDPVIDMVERDVSLIRELGLDLKFVVNTHVHADHITGMRTIMIPMPHIVAVNTHVHADHITGMWTIMIPMPHIVAVNTHVHADHITGMWTIMIPMPHIVAVNTHVHADHITGMWTIMIPMPHIVAVNTHVHADHITGSGEIKRRVQACRSVIAGVSQAQADVKVEEGSTIPFGPFHLECYSTPGHTDGCMSYVLRPACMVFTGDAVLIRGCGRTDFQQGDAGRLYDSVHAKIFTLPRNFTIYPAHDYTGQTSSTVDEELKFNRRLTRTREEFVQIMKELNLPYPKQIDLALPANMVCGVYDVEQKS